MVIAAAGVRRLRSAQRNAEGGSGAVHVHTRDGPLLADDTVILLPGRLVYHGTPSSKRG